MCAPALFAHGRQMNIESSFPSYLKRLSYVPGSHAPHSITSSARASRRWRHIEAEHIGGPAPVFRSAQVSSKTTSCGAAKPSRNGQNNENDEFASLDLSLPAMHGEH